MIACILLEQAGIKSLLTLKSTHMKNQSIYPFNFQTRKNFSSPVKQTTHIILLFCIIFTLIPGLSSFSKNMNKNTKGKITIVDIKEGIDPEITTVTHKPLEVQVYRLLLKEGDSILGKSAQQIYSVRYFKTENDTLTGYKAWLVNDDNYDKANYSWLNDSTVSLRLYNKATKKEWVTELYGMHGASGIIVRDHEK